jgi:hypothetical protein
MPETQSWRRDAGMYRGTCSCGWSSGPFVTEWRARTAGEAHAKWRHGVGLTDAEQQEVSRLFSRAAE